MLTKKTDTIRLDYANLQSAKFEIQDEAEFDPLSFRFSGHSLIGANFSNSDLSGCSFMGADLRDIKARDATFEGDFFDESDLSRADLSLANCSSARLWRITAREINASNIDLTDANLYKAEFDNGSMQHAILEEARCIGTSFLEANLENTNLIRTKLEGADLTDARLYGAEIRFTSLGETTELGNRCIYEKEAVAEVVSTLEPNSNLRQKLRTAWGYYQRSPSTDTDPGKLRKAIRVYRMYQRLLRENDLPRDVSWYRVREREARRKLALQENKWWRWLNYSLQRWTMNYGESPWRVVGISLLTMLFSAILYPLIGGIQAPPTADGTRTIAFDFLPTVSLSLPSPIAKLAISLYFSVGTFTTHGYGDFQPATGAAQALASLESFAGALLMALLVFVLGRRSTW